MANLVYYRVAFLVACHGGGDGGQKQGEGSEYRGGNRGSGSGLCHGRGARGNWQFIV